jgi:hypothetical protein
MLHMLKAPTSTRSFGRLILGVCTEAKRTAMIAPPVKIKPTNICAAMSEGNDHAPNTARLCDTIIAQMTPVGRQNCGTESLES